MEGVRRRRSRPRIPNVRYGLTIRTHGTCMRKRTPPAAPLASRGCRRARRMCRPTGIEDRGLLGGRKHRVAGPPNQTMAARGLGGHPPAKKPKASSSMRRQRKMALRHCVSNRFLLYYGSTRQPDLELCRGAFREAAWQVTSNVKRENLIAGSPFLG